MTVKETQIVKFDAILAIDLFLTAFKSDSLLTMEKLEYRAVYAHPMDVLRTMCLLATRILNLLYPADIYPVDICRIFILLQCLTFLS